MVKTISILGCGWLGMPLGSVLAHKGMKVKGSSTDISKMKEIMDNGMMPFHININPEINKDYNEKFFSADLLFVNIPPGRKNLHAVNYLEIQKQIIGHVNHYGIKDVIFISSTSVYNEKSGAVDEYSATLPSKESGCVLLNAEKLYLNEKGFSTNVVRFGGLIGGNRNPGRFLAGKKEIPNVHAPVNLIHRDDCINIIYTLIQSQFRNEIFNACMPDHPTKKIFYESAALKNGYEKPKFMIKEKDGNFGKYKIVNSVKIKEKLHYGFLYNSPMDCI